MSLFNFSNDVIYGQPQNVSKLNYYFYCYLSDEAERSETSEVGRRLLDQTGSDRRVDDLIH